MRAQGPLDGPCDCGCHDHPGDMHFTACCYYSEQPRAAGEAEAARLRGEAGKNLRIFVYETESVAFEAGCVEIVIVAAENREQADQAMLADPNCWVSDKAHLKNFRVEEKPLQAAVLFRGKVLERLDPHEYD